MFLNSQLWSSLSPLLLFLLDSVSKSMYMILFPYVYRSLEQMFSTFKIVCETVDDKCHE